MTAFACTDAKDRDMFSDFEAWTQQTLWPAIKQKFGGTNILDQDTSSLKVSFSTPRITSLHQDVKEAIVTEARSLTKDDSFGEKRHLEIRLPTGMTYITGDYLAILPLNPREVVNRTLRRFELAWDAHIFIQTTGHTSLPVDMSVPVSDVLSSYVELSTTATRRNISALAQHTTDPKLTDELRALGSDDDYECRVRAKKVSVLDILEWYPSLTLPFEQFLALLPPMRARQYSISSTPLVDPGVVTLTYSVLNEPALSGQGQYVGVATSYLACLRPGDKVQVAVRSANGGFRLPDVKDPTPCIFIGAGTGLAPLRSFVQERAIRGENASKALLFFGCRSPEVDDLYREEFDQWESQGAVKVYRAFSRKPEISSGCKYVQALLLAERDTISSLWREGAKIFVCGSSKVADGVKDALVQIIVEEQAGMTKEMAEKWFEEQRNERYAVDVFD
jgi:cytochrome P450/NADPH-cytochrome P450 reductase